MKFLKFLKSQISLKSLKFLNSRLTPLSFLFFGASATILPPMLQSGDTVGLISSAFRVDSNGIYQDARARLERLGLRVQDGQAVMTHHQYFAGSIQARANDVNQMFANPKIKAIFEIRGGFGSAQILPYLNYPMIAAHPKPLIGFSDITSLLIALYTQANIVSYYGPMPGAYTWPPYTVNGLKQVLFTQHQQITLRNQSDTPIETITPGIAHGVLLGGNLSVLVSLIGTPYFPRDWHGKILYVEDTGEDVYQVDRMLTQLQLAGVFSQISGFIFGQCTHCTRLVPGSLSMQEVIREHIAPYGMPAFMGLQFGHQDSILTLPEGLEGTMNANTGIVEFQN